MLLKHLHRASLRKLTIEAGSTRADNSSDKHNPPMSLPLAQVAINHDKDYGRPDVSRIASANGSWDHLAINRIAKVPMGTGTAPPVSSFTHSRSSMSSTANGARVSSDAPRKLTPTGGKSLKDVGDV